MKNSDDIVNLFQQFGAKADPYQELARKHEHKLSSERWPLLSAVRDAMGEDVPPVQRRVGTTPASAPLPPSAPARTAAWPDAADEARRAAPQALKVPVSVMAFSPAPTPTSAMPPDRSPASAAPNSRSPLASLAGLHAGAGASARDEHAKSRDPLPVDLTSVFARLADESPSGSTSAWQPRKGHL
ncbi:cellulose biosynthesis protein BcsP [Acidovorax sp.]|uniref:cellulose biosynthesis protein BcsP n=1 Tax=Acidovorax sp. TaxID=1872122 RepID=UPI003444593B